MNHTTISLIFTLLRSVICGNQLSQNEKLLFTEENIAELFALSKHHDIAHLIAFVLQKNEILENQKKRFDSYIFTAIYRYEQINYTLGKVCEALETAKIPFIPLKGSVIRKYYPEPWMRTSCDIDVLIHKDDIDRAIQFLCDTGYIRQEDSTTHDCSLMSPSGVHLELHYSLEQEGLPAADALLKSVWEHCSVKDGAEFHYIMSNEIFLFYHIAHMAKHFVRGGCGIRSFIDLWLLNQKMPIETEKLYAMLEQANLFEFYKATSKLATVWMENQSHDTVTKSMEAFVLTGGVYGSAINLASVKAAKGESKLKIFFKLMFLPRKNLEIIYPNLKKHSWLFPFYQFKRWFRVLNKKKRKRISNLTTARKLVQKDARDEISNLLTDLGLL